MTKEEIREYRKNVLRMSQESLAVHLGYCSGTIIAHYENGVSPVPAGYAERMKSVDPYEGNDRYKTPQIRRSKDQLDKIDGLIKKYHGILTGKQIAAKTGEPVKYIYERISQLKRRGLLNE